MPYVLRDLGDLVFFLEVSDDLLVSCLFTEMGLAGSMPRVCRCLVEARLHGQKPVMTGKVCVRQVQQLDL